MKRVTTTVKVLSSATVVGLLLAACSSVSPSASATGSNTGLVTTTKSSGTVKLGLPYVDTAPLAAEGVNIDQGSYPDAFNALVANLNAHGGINGKKVITFTEKVNPVSSTAAASACTTFTQDNKVLAVIGPVYPLCYQQGGVASIAGTIGASSSPKLAPNFTLTPPASAFDPLLIQAMSNKGVFKGMKVGVIATSADKPEMNGVLTSLKKQKVDVVQTAINSAPNGDLAASEQQIQAISQRFQSSGIKVVVGVGSGSTSWLVGMEGIQSPYTPRIVATNATTFLGTVDGKGTNDPKYLKGAISATPIPSQTVIWKDPAIQKCVSIIKKAYPSTDVGDPIGSASTSVTPWVASENTCQWLDMFSTIAKAAGKNLTPRTFQAAGYGLRNVTFPGAGASVSFGPGRSYALGPVYLMNYNMQSHQLVTSETPTKTN